jgi:hypothetical protein
VRLPPHLGSHDHGPHGCSCQQTPEQRQTAWEERRRDLEAWWASDEYQEAMAADQAAMQAAQAWAETHGMVAERHTCFAPEQWTGTVDGVSYVDVNPVVIDRKQWTAKKPKPFVVQIRSQPLVEIPLERP